MPQPSRGNWLLPVPRSPLPLTVRRQQSQTFDQVVVALLATSARAHQTRQEKLNILPLLSLLNCEWHNKRTGATAECRAARTRPEDAAHAQWCQIAEKCMHE